MKLESLDLAIGMIVVFLLVSTLCSALREAIEALLKTRAAYLETAIREMLDDKDGKGLTQSLFDHPLLSGLFLGKYQPKPAKKKLWVLANGRGLPSYVPASSFAKALLDLAARGPAGGAQVTPWASGAATIAALRARLQSPNNGLNPNVSRALLHAIDTAQGDLKQAEKNVASWFDDSMDRVAGWYKRSTQWLVFVIALVVTVLGNVDSIAIAKHLYQDETARAAAVQSAEASVAGSKLPEPQKAREVLEQLELPIGWTNSGQPVGWGMLDRVLGWLLTTFAATLGAPFWFDVLNKVMVIRSTVKPREKSPNEASEDRQAPPAPVVNVPPSPAPAAAPAQSLATVSEQNELDCCGGGLAEPTDDADLPAAEGGMQS